MGSAQFCSTRAGACRETFHGNAARCAVAKGGGSRRLDFGPGVTPGGHGIEAGEARQGQQRRR
jgi:hypothetical protein